MARDVTQLDISGKRKAAIFLACVGADKASRIMSAMSDERSIEHEKHMP